MNRPDHAVAQLVAGGGVPTACVALMTPRGVTFAAHPQRRAGRFDEGSVFEIGSLTKCVTGTVLADLVLEGALGPRADGR